MAKKQAGENSKKAAGNAKVILFYDRHNSAFSLTFRQKAEAANQKAAVENAKRAVAEDQEWSKGAKSNAKKSVVLATRE